MQFRFDNWIGLVMLLVVIGILLAVASAVMPSVQSTADSIFDLRLAPQRAESKLQAEKLLAKAQADEIAARIEVSRTMALANADAVRVNAQANLKSAEVALQDAIARVKKIEADERVSIVSIENAWKPIAALMFGLVLVFLILAASYCVRIRSVEKTNQAQIESRKTLMLKALDAGQQNGLTVTLDNGHSFEIKPMQIAIPARVPDADTTTRADAMLQYARTGQSQT